MTEIVGTVQPVRSPQEWGGLWKRERERKPLGGERISSLLRSLPSQKGCRSHPGKPVLRMSSTQSIKDNVKEKGHKGKKETHKIKKRQPPRLPLCHH